MELTLKTKDYQKLSFFAQNIASSLEEFTPDWSDDGDTRIRLKDENSAAPVRDWWSGVCAKMTNYTWRELDEAYLMLSRTCEIILDNEGSLETVREAMQEYDHADDSLVAAVRWFSENLDREKAIDEAQEYHQTTSVFESISRAQQHTRSEYCMEIYQAMLKHLKIEDAA